VVEEERQGYEYDIAVSFAGEERDYVEAVISMVGDDVKVFYDRDEKSKLWGEDLIDLLTDVYQRSVHFVVMFVSAAYSQKMWPNVERRSAMARAAAQRGAYILPIRMDDTELPGLLSTVGYLDARDESKDEIAKAIREKLGHERAHFIPAGGAPVSCADTEPSRTRGPETLAGSLVSPAGLVRVRLDLTAAAQCLTLGWQLARYEFIHDSGIPEAARADVELREEIEALAHDGLSLDGLSAPQAMRKVLFSALGRDIGERDAILIGIAACRAALFSAASDKSGDEERAQLVYSVLLDVSPDTLVDTRGFFSLLMASRPDNVAALLRLIQQ